MSAKGKPDCSDSATSLHQCDRSSHTRERHSEKAAIRSAMSITIFFSKGLPGPFRRCAAEPQSRCYLNSEVALLVFVERLLDQFLLPAQLGALDATLEPSPPDGLGITHDGFQDLKAFVST